MTAAATPRTLGIVVLGLGHRTLAGMVGDARSHPEGTLVERVHAEDLLRKAAQADPELLESVAEAARRLVAKGADLVATSCGYFSPFQRPLAAALPVPVFTTPMMELATLLASLPEDRTVLVVAAVAHGVDDRCLAACGVRAEDMSRVVVVGMDRPGHFEDSVLTHRVDPEEDAFTAQVVDVVGEAMTESVGAIVLECGEMPAAAAAVRERFAVPVVDYGSYLDAAVRTR